MIQLRVAAMFFFTGLGIIVGLIVVVYALTWVFDRCSGDHNNMLTPEELEERRIASNLTKRAGLAGMLSSERSKVIRHFFEARSFAYTKKKDAGDNDIESQKKDKEPMDNDGELTEQKETKNIEDKPEQTELSEPRDEVEETEEQKVDEGGDEKDNDDEDEIEKPNPDSSKIPDVDDDIESQKKPDGDESIEQKETMKSEKSDSNEARSSEPSSVCDDRKGDAKELQVENGASKGNEENDIENQSFKVSEEEAEQSEIETEEENHPERTSKGQQMTADEKGEGGEEETSPSSEIAESGDPLEPEEGVCPICINEYDEGDKVITGTSCLHMFHYDCSMQWLDKGHDECPCCRKDMLTADELLDAAREALGEGRVTKLKNVNAAAAMRLSQWEEGNRPRREEEAAIAAAQTPTTDRERTSNGDSLPTDPPGLSGADVVDN